MKSFLKKEKEITYSPNKIKIPLSDNENGIPDEFIQTNDNNCQEIFTCAICSCLAWEPVCCPKCDKIFCRSCRLKYGENKICPFKCDSYTFREITRNERDFLNKINLKCSNPGCSEYVPYFSYKNHLEKCKFRKYHCKNDPCQTEGYLNEIIEHSKICKYRRIICHKCRLKVKYCEMKIHPNEQCPETIVKCKYCGLKMKRGIYQKEHSSKNNSNPNCLKIQMENLLKTINKKDNEITDLKNRIKDLEKKNEKNEKENNNLKQKLKDIKQFITNGYNKYILEEEDNEKNIGDILNINEEINKKNEIEEPKVEKENFNVKKNYSVNVDKRYLNTESNFYSRNNNNYLNYKSDTFNNSASEIKIDRISDSNKKEPNKVNREQVVQPIHIMRKVPSFSFLPNNNYNNNIGYRKRFINSTNKSNI